MWSYGQTEEKRELRKLQDTAFIFAHPQEDIRGRKLIDHNGTRLGRVHALYIDVNERTVPFLEISTGGPVGMASPTFLIPVSYITDIRDQEVQINRHLDRPQYGTPYSPELQRPAPSKSPYDPLLSISRSQRLHNKRT